MSTPAWSAALTSASRVASTRASSAGVGRRVADDHGLDGDAVGLLDLGGDLLHGGGEGHGRAGGRGVEPAAELALLRAGEPGDLARVVGGLADEGEGLQHRVVDVRGDVGALLLADVLAPLVLQLGRGAQPPGAARTTRPRTVRTVESSPSRAAPSSPREARKPASPSASRTAPPRHGQQPAPAGGARPAGALRLVGLPPHERDSGAGCEQRQQRQRADWWGSSSTAPRPRAARAASCARPWAVAGREGRPSSGAPCGRTSQKAA